MKDDRSSRSSDNYSDSKSIFDNRLFFAGMGAIFLFIVLLFLYFIDFTPGLSHLDVSVYSGLKSGNYYLTVEESSKIALSKRGTIRNISTNGSVDNIKRLGEHRRGGAFALVQNGLPWEPGLELVAHLKSPETVFFLGPKADGIRSLADLRNLRIGIGPGGSGTAHLAETIFNIPAFTKLNVKLSNHASDEQLRMLQAGKLDLGIFVISEKSEFIERAILDMGMQIAGLRQCESISMRLPFLRTAYIAEGLYDPVKNLPRSRKKVLKVDTLIISNGKTSRSQVMGVLGVFTGAVSQPGKLQPDGHQPHGTARGRGCPGFLQQ